jgi:hypothetical protein
MKTCRQCGMPAPGSTTHCGWCNTEFTEAATYRLSPAEGGYSWSAERGRVAEARQSEAGLWQVFDAATGDLAITLVAIEMPDELRVALLDNQARSLATVLVDPSSLPRRSRGSRRGLGFVRNRRNEPLLAMYGDGPTGVHLVNHEHDVVALASQVRGGKGGLDVMVTARRHTPNPITLCAVLLSLELARAGQLRPAV